jgi:hypothetical protein
VITQTSKRSFRHSQPYKSGATIHGNGNREDRSPGAASDRMCAELDAIFAVDQAERVAPRAVRDQVAVDQAGERGDQRADVFRIEVGRQIVDGRLDHGQCHAGQAIVPIADDDTVAGVPLVAQLTTVLIVATMTTVGLPDTSTYPTIELVSCLVVASACAYGSRVRFIRSASATAFVSRALNPQDGSNLSRLTRTDGSLLTSPQPEKRNVHEHPGEFSCGVSVPQVVSFVTGIKAEAMCCLKRYIAREIYRAVQQPSPTTIAPLGVSGIKRVSYMRRQAPPMHF